MNQVPVTVVQPGEGEYVALPGFGAVFKLSSRSNGGEVSIVEHRQRYGLNPPSPDLCPSSLVSGRFGGLADSSVTWYLPVAGWSSSVARWAHNPEVAGSNPVPATMWCRKTSE